MNKHFILATAGHVDHGKSSLVKALSGMDPDRLPEEKARGISIELGFAYLDLNAPGDPQTCFRVGIVDVPGHEDFVKNMVAGVGSVDLALLVVAADDGWMPQTEEHLQILQYLGLAHLVVALTKTDLTTVDHTCAANAIRTQLQGTPFSSAPIVPVSTVTRRGIDELKRTLASMLQVMPEPADVDKPRLAVDRAFSLHGIGTVVTGTLAGGAFLAGQNVLIQPAGHPARIRSIQSHNQNLSSLGPGRRAALNLADVQVTKHSREGQHGVYRGDVITLAGSGRSSSVLDVLLTRSARLLELNTPASRPLKHGTPVRVHLGAGNCNARLRLLDRQEIASGQTCIARLSLERPAFTLVGDRLILRDFSEQATLAGGVVLDAAGAPGPVRDPLRRRFLERCAASVGNLQARLAAQIAFEGIVGRADLIACFPASAQEIVAQITSLSAKRSVLVFGELVADSQWWTMLKQAAIGLIDTTHRTYPERPGAPLSQLRTSFQRELRLPGTFEALLAELVKESFVQMGNVIKRTSHRPSLPARLQAGGSKLRASLAKKALEPPARSELVRDADTQQALRFLLETGELVELGPDLIMLRETFSSATEVIRGFLKTHGSASVSELRQAVGTTRRVILPLLEALDRAGITQRQGDQRILRRAPASTQSAIAR